MPRNWYTITDKADADVLRVDIYGDIGDVWDEAINRHIACS